MTKQEKLKLLSEATTKINKDFGEHSVMSLSDKPEIREVVSTGSLGLDLALGVKGLPKGRIVEIYGPESSGKTTIAIHVIAEAQKQGGVCAVIDAEHAFDRQYATNLGVNVDELLISQPDYGEQALEIADRLISSGGIDVIIVDSVAALVPKGELDGEMGDSRMGVHARLMSQAMRKLTAIVSKNNTLLIFINQLRDKIGVMFGSPETTTGGNALKFYASVRLDVRRSLSAEGTIKEGDVKIGNKTTVKVVKNKVAPPFKHAEFDIIYGKGIDKNKEIIDAAIDLKIINKGGAWITYKDIKIQGLNNFIDLLENNPDLFEEIKAQVLEKIYN